MPGEKSDALADSAEAVSLAEGRPANDDTSLPAFANAGNRALDTETRSLHKQLQVADEELLDNTDTVSVLLEHLGKAKRDVRLASARLADSSNRFSTDEHLYQLSLRQLVGKFAVVQRCLLFNSWCQLLSGGPSKNRTAVVS